jgi:PEP-CTERM motif-containing protein
MNRMIIGLTLWLLMAPVAAGAVPVSLETGVSYPQQENRPCIIGNPSCHNPAGFGFTLIPVNTSAGTLTSPVYTLDQIRSAVGDRFAVGIDVNEAQQVYSLQSFEFNIDGGSPEYTYTGPADIPAVNKGNGFSDARLVSFDITGLTGTGVFSATFANADAGREQFFLIANDDGLAPVPEPGTVLLLATSMLGVSGAVWRRPRRGPAMS